MEITEDFDIFLTRITRKLAARLVALEKGEEADVLAKIDMSKRLMRALEDQICLLVLHGVDDRGDVPLNEPPRRPHTWKEIGEALGVSAQAAQRKYGSSAREDASGGGAPAPG
ncbi:hypothetical protein SMD20_26685 [Nonomuraea sp. LP-02]|uniref:hypothetical protein n=1 Tax=Nonomuraea sp. LP-02 TaxID=3097960 RepID=UPI002E36230A|nr:hypothetical protein [Nonomuraea sp. LP-02]MED7927874.1 hypothetical protein [Nonomuraea sp. LP-02]